MSLFPAYASTSAEKSTEKNTEEDQQWLENSSFQIDVTGISLPSSSVPEENTANLAEKTTKSKSKKHKKHRHNEKNAKKDELKDKIDDLIYKKRNSELLSVKTIARPSAPTYKIKFFIRDQKKPYAKKKFKRYYDAIPLKQDDKSDDENAAKITEKDLKNPPPKETNEHFTGFKQEDEMSQMTASYNRKLAENSADIDTWLDYVKFQDAIFQFEKTYRKGSIAKGLRVTAERKLSILDKALSHNPDCERLMRERLNIAVSVYPSDELQTQLHKLVDKDQGNIILWQGYIEATQCSMSHCNTPAVLALYTKCLSTLHKLRRNATLERALLEESILRMLYQCGLFLKQSGLFEQLWTLLRMYLELNLSPTDKNKFNIGSNFRDEQLLELEEVILNSQLPIHELWLRVEKLREACHWVPALGEQCDDPQRLVFPEDVSELIHPITMPENLFKFTATVLTLLKLPLLPCRHTAMQELGLDYVPWALDSIESLLPMFFPMYPVNTENKYFLRDYRLAVGPQYLKVLPGQEEYLEFLLRTMSSCIDCLNGNDKVAVVVWWFRFQRLLLVLEKQNRFKVSAGFKKRIKSNLKGLLKQEANRNNLIFYVEYALTELEISSAESALNVLLTALNLVPHSCVTEIKDLDEKAAFCALNRVTIEIYLHPKSSVENTQQKALKHLVTFVLGKTATSAGDYVTQGSLTKAGLKFKHTTLKLLQENQENLTPVQHFLPNFFTDFVICNGWFLYLTKGPIECGTFLEDILDSLESPNYQKEVIFEFYVAVLFKHCLDNAGSGIFRILDDVLQRALLLFPNNVFLLSVLAKELSLNYCLGKPWWKLKSLLVKTQRALPILFLVLISFQQMDQAEEAWKDSITGKNYVPDVSSKNRILSLFRHVTKPDICTRRCGLVWRLYLQFVHANFNPKLCRDVYYTAVEECPWLKALYIDAAIYIPGELAQIQDLLIEKQLRIHITPEELDILRN